MTPVLGILIAIASGIGLVAICIIIVMRLKYTHGYQSASHPDYPETHIQLNKTVLNNPDVIPADKGKKIFAFDTNYAIMQTDKIFQQRKAMHLFKLIKVICNQLIQLIKEIVTISAD